MLLNRDLLRAAWTAAGETQHDAAKRLNLSDRTMTDRMKSGVFGSDEIEKLVKAYRIKDPLAVFFAQQVT